jgi:hypothetical protein
MPVDWSRYPENWKEVVARIRKRSGDKCEWCGLVNGEIGMRMKNGAFHTVSVPPAIDAATLKRAGLTRIVLTTAHLATPHADGRPGDKHDKMDVREENLGQRCHLLYDLPEHMENARKTRDRKAGRISLFEGGA